MCGPQKFRHPRPESFFRFRDLCVLLSLSMSGDVGDTRANIEMCRQMSRHERAARRVWISVEGGKDVLVGRGRPQRGV